MPLDPDLQNRLMELVFGLLPDEEAAELRAAIAEDARLAEALAEAQANAQLMGEAARLASPKIVLNRPEPNARNRTAVPDLLRSHLSPELTPWSGWAQWAILTTACLLILVSLLGWTRNRSHPANVGSDQLRLQVTGPSQIQASVDNSYSVTTTTASGQPVSSNVHFALCSPDGARVLGHTEKTDANGVLQIHVPAGLDLPEEVRLTVKAGQENPQQLAESRVPVRQELFSTCLSLDQLRYAPGETLRYRSTSLSRFHLEPCRDLPIEFEVLDPQGTAMQGTHQELITNRGVAAGEFLIPAGAVSGVYAIVVSSSDPSLVGDRCEFLVEDPSASELRKELEFAGEEYGPGMEVFAALRVTRTEGAPVAGAEIHWTAKTVETTIAQDSTSTDGGGGAIIRFALPAELGASRPFLVVAVRDGAIRETMTEPVPLGSGKLVVDFCPEGGDLAAVGENRVYFAARDENGEPVDLTGWIVDEQGNYVAAVATEHQGRGTFRFSPRVGVRYRLIVQSPPYVESECQLPFAVPSQKIVLNTGVGVFGPGKPIEFNVRASQSGLPLVAMASCRGVHVGQRVVLTKTPGSDQGGTAANAVAIPVPDTAAGVIRLTVFDYSTSPPQPIAERLVYRRPHKRLDVQLTPDRTSYLPGDSCRLGVRVVNETGTAVQSLMGLSVVDEQGFEAVGAGPATMSSHFWLTSEVEYPQDLEDANFLLESTPEAEVALDLLLGTQGWRRFAKRSITELRSADAESEKLDHLVKLPAEATPPLMLDNLASLKVNLQTKQGRDGEPIGRTGGGLAALIVLGGAGLLVLVTMMSLLRIAGGVRAWAPAVIAVGSSFFFVFLILTPDPLSDRSVAFVSYRPPEIGESADLAAESEGRGPALGDKFAEDRDLSLGGAPADVPAEAETQPHKNERQELLQGSDSPVATPAETDQDKASPAAETARTPQPESLPAEVAETSGMVRQPADATLDNKQQISAESSQESLSVRQFCVEPGKRERLARKQLAKTIFWQPLLATDAKGRVEAAFELPDSVTRVRAVADAIGGQRIGSTVQTMVSQPLFHLSARIPSQVTLGDRLEVPVTIVSESLREEKVHVTVETASDLRQVDAAEHVVTIGDSGQSRCMFSAEALKLADQTVLRIRGKTGQFTDLVEQPLRVEAPGYPQTQVVNGILKGEQPLALEIPKDVVDGSIDATMTLFPSLAAELQMGLQSIDDDRFDSALATIAVADLIVDNLKKHQIADPEVLRASKLRRSDALQRLGWFRDAQGGYSSIENGPAAIAATAQALGVLVEDRNSFGSVSPQIGRSTEWLAGQINSQEFSPDRTPGDDAGGFAWALWALAASGQTGLESTLERVSASAVAAQDSRRLAWAALAADRFQREDLVAELLGGLSKQQADTGQIGGDTMHDLETTALAIQAWLTQPAFADSASRAVMWLESRRDESGGFGDALATSLVLQALAAHAENNHRVVRAGTVAVRNGAALLAQQEIQADRRDAVVLHGLEEHLETGRNSLTMGLTAGNELPYTVVVRYHRQEQPTDSGGCPLTLRTDLETQKLVEAGTARITVRLKNTGEQIALSPVLHIGLPAGLDVIKSLLDAEKKAGRILAYETQHRRLILSWPAISPGEEVQWAIEVSATVPGHFSGPASFACLRQHPKARCWAKPLSVEIVTKK